MASVTIASGGTTSTAIDLSTGQTLLGLLLPGTLTSTAFTLLASADNSTFTAVYDKSGTQYSITVAASRWVLLPPADFAGFTGWLKLVGSTEGGDRTITILTRPL